MTISVASSDSSEGSASVGSLVFTSANWNTPQIVTVTGVNDSVDDSNIAYALVLGTAVSADASYSGLDATDVGLVNTDDDLYSTVTVDTNSDVLDGDTLTIETLLANKGADGKISLREAILAANNSENSAGGVDRIHFNISGAGTHTIHLSSALPTITDPVVIDGYTQPGASANTLAMGTDAVLRIVLDGINAGESTPGLAITAGGTTVRGLVINNFTWAGVHLDGGDGNTIAGNYIGTDASGTIATPNGRGTGYDGILIGYTAASSNNTIGGSTPGDRNVISGNSGGGIWMASSNGGNLIRGNYIGVDATGNTGMGNGQHGIILSGAANSVINNVISGNGQSNYYGLYLPSGADGTTVQGNLIGVGADGTTAIPNSQHNVYISSDDNIIGGTAAGQGNTIANSTGKGIVVTNGATGNAILGNSMYANSGVGIDLRNNGVTVNDGAKNAARANYDMDFPLLTSASLSGTTLTVAGFVGAAPNQATFASARLEVFKSDGDTTGYGEGRIYLGFLTSDASGNFSGTLDVTGKGLSAGDKLTATATDASNNTSEFSLNIVVNNSAPVLAGANNLSAITENPTSNPGTLVSNLIAGQVNDADPGASVGIAVVAADNTNGVWQYSTNGGSNWTNFGTPSATSSRLLAANASTYVRFVPNAGWSGTVANGITFRAWDQTEGSAGSAINTNANGANTAFSAASAGASITVNSANDAPVLDSTRSPALTSISEDAAAPSGAVGTLVSALVDFASPSGQVDNVTDADNGALLGIAVTAADTTNGGWWYSTDGGTNWNALGVVANNNARLLAADANTRLYFQPNANYNGTLSSAITFRAWDQTSGSNGGLADPTTNGGTTAFSTSTDTASLVVSAVNDPPVNTLTGAGAVISEDTATQLVGVISIADVDGGSGSFTVTLSVNTAAGTFSANTAAGVTVSGSGTDTLVLSGTLASINAYLASVNTAPFFTPTADYNGTVTVTLVTNDNGNTGSGGAQSDSDTVSGTISAVADIADDSITTNEDTPVTFAPLSNDTFENAGRTITHVDGTAISSGGSVAVTGGTVTLNAGGTLSFVPTADYNGAPSFTYTVTSGGATETATVSVTVNAANDPPTATIVPASYSATEQTPLTLHGTGLSIGDVDAGASTVQAIISVVSGTLSAAAGTTGVTVSGSGTSTVTLSGTLTQINHLLAGSGGATLTYTIDSDAPPASDTLTLAVSDLGNSGSGGAKTASDTATLNITATNDAPSGTTASLFAAINEDDFNSAGKLVSDFTADTSDPDAGALKGIYVHSANSTNGQWQYTLDGSNWVNFGAVSANNALLLPSDVLTRVRFVPNADYNGTVFPFAFGAWDQTSGVAGGYADVTVTGGSTAFGATGTAVSITVNPTNDPPIAAHDRLALDFDGVDDHVSVPHSASLAMGATMTMEAWVNPDVSGNSVQMILNKEGEYEMAILADGSLNFAFAEGGTWSWHDTGVDIADHTWTHVAITYNAGTVTTYINGTEVNSQVMATSTIGDVYPAMNELRIGGRTNNPAGQYFDGRIADVRVWNVVRNQAEIAGAMNATLSGTEAGLAGNWALDDNSGATAADRTANANDGTLRNGAAWTGYRVNEDSVLNVAGPGVLANDYDADGNSLTAVLVSGPSHGSLTLNADGSFTYTPTADWHGTDSFSYRANDGTTNSNVATVTLVVDPQNDQPTTTPVTLASIAEDSGPRLITQAQLLANANDIDGDGLSATGLSLSSGNGSLIDNGNGTWTYTPAANDDSSVAFTYTITDGSLTAVGSATLDITPLNDAPEITPFAPDVTFVEGGMPQLIDPTGTVADVDSADFDGGVLTISITQNASAHDRLTVGNFGSAPGQVGVSGSDVTYGGTIVGSFAGGTSGSDPLLVTFNANATLAAVQEVRACIQFANVSSNPSTLTRQVTFELTDGDGGTAVPKTKLVYVQATNNPPVITSGGGGAAAAVSVAENATAVTTVTSSDVDGGVASYSIIGGADAGLFSIDASTGALRFDAAPNFEAPADVGADNVYDVTVQVSDGAGGTDTQAIAVTVTNVNEGAVGAISDANAAANSVAENAAAGTLVGVTAVASDPDSTDTVSYSLDDSAGGRFAIDANTGVVTVADGSLLNREAAANHTITVRATSSDGSFSTANFSLNVTDVDEFDVGALGDSNATANSVAENAANGTLVGITAAASDADATNNTVTYTLTDDAGGRFAIDANTGVVTVADGSLLNREAAASHTITVQATSADGSGSTQSFSINVTDVDESDVTIPVDADVTANAVNENVAIGTTVGVTAFAFDADATANAVTYSLSSNPGGLFAIDGNTGVLTTAVALDREAIGANVVVEVTATSADGSSAVQSFTVGINDVDEFDVTVIGDSDPGANSAAENAANGTTVGLTVLASDADATNNIVTYALTDDAGGRFAIDANSGVVTVADGSLLDREAAASHTITVRASSSDGSSSTASFTINLTDVDEFDVGAIADANAGTNSVAENAANGTLVGVTALAADADATNNTVTYALSNDAGGRFAIDANSGVVTVADGSLLDREAAASHTITVLATSADGSTSIQSFTISLTDIDEFDVAAISDANAGDNSVAENAANGTLVGITASASDADATNNTVTYTLTDDAGGRFAIDATTGVVTVANGTLLDREAAASHNITVLAASSDGSSSSASFAINVTGVNDNAPVIASDGGGATASVSVAENSTGVTTVSATDTDLPAQTLSYAIVGGADAGLFSIDAASGALSFNAAPNFEAPGDAGGDNVYDVTVQASDGAGGTDTQAIAVTVTNVNEMPVGSNGTVTTNEDTGYRFVAADFGFADVDGGDSLSAVRVESLPGAGRLTLSGSPVIAGQVISTAELGDLVFDPAPDANGVGYASFDVSVRDQAGAFAAAPSAITVDVASVDDGPVMRNAVLSLHPGQRIVLSEANLGASDVDSPLATLVYAVSNVQNGHFERLSSPGIAVTRFGHPELMQGMMQFVHTTGAPAPSFEIRVTDGSTDSAPLMARVSLVVDVAPEVVAPGGGGGSGGSNESGAGSGSGGIAGGAALPTSGASAAKSVASSPTPGVRIELLLYQEARSAAVRDGTTIAPVFEAAPLALRPVVYGVSEAARNVIRLDVHQDEERGDYVVTVLPAQTAAVMHFEPGAAIAEAAQEEDAPVEAVVDQMRLVGMTMSAGMVWWAARVSGLMASVLATSPAWRQIDLLPILGRPEGENEEETGGRMAETGAALQAEVEAMFAEPGGDYT